MSNAIETILADVAVKGVAELIIGDTSQTLDLKPLSQDHFISSKTGLSAIQTIHLL